MSRQEEIVEGMKPILYDLRDKMLAGETDIKPYVNRLVSYLYSQRVVIKKNKEAK